MKDRSAASLKMAMIAATMVLLAAFFQSRGLIATWARDPGSAFGGSAFALWAGCILGSRFLAKDLFIDRRFVGAGAVCLVLATLSGIALLNHLAIALCLSSCLREGWARWVSLGAALSWIPALGWLSHTLLGEFPGAVRPLLAGVAFVAFLSLKQVRVPQTKEAFS